MIRILVVDDHNGFRTEIGRLVSLVMPYALVLQARNGREGIATALAEKPDMILMDMDMPVMDGYEAAKALRAVSSTCHIPLIVMSLQPGEDAHTLARIRPYCQAILFKPFEAVHLAVAIQLVGIGS